MPTPPETILIVEDDRNTAALVCAYLEREGFATATAEDGTTALALFRQRVPVLVILDVMIPGIDGWEVCRQLRKGSEVPILFLSAREEEIDRVLGLSLGADDYVVKPFSPRELVERVKAILRRARPSRPAGDDTMLRCGALVLDAERHLLTRAGRPVALTAAEFKLLQALMAAAGRVLTRAELLDRLYPHGELVVDRVVDVHIGKLRQKLEDDPARPRDLQTVRGFGYRFAEDAGEGRG